LKHLNQTLETCYESLLQELTKKRSKCPRLYLLNDEDLVEIMCCANNLEMLSSKINKVFNQVESFDFDAENRIHGLIGKNHEYFPLKTVIVTFHQLSHV